MEGAAEREGEGEEEKEGEENNKEDKSSEKTSREKKLKEEEEEEEQVGKEEERVFSGILKMENTATISPISSPYSSGSTYVKHPVKYLKAC